MKDDVEVEDIILTPIELAKRLRVSIWTVRLRSKGKRPKIPSIRIGNGKGMAVRYHWPTVIKALSKGALVIILFGLTTGVAGEPQTGGRGNNLPSVTRETISFSSAHGIAGEPRAHRRRENAWATERELRGAKPFAAPEPASKTGHSPKLYGQVPPLRKAGQQNPVSGVASFYGERHRGKPTTSGELCSPNALSCASWFNPSGARLSPLGIIAALYGLAVLGTLTHVARLTLKRTV